MVENLKEIVFAATVEEEGKRRLYCETAFALAKEHGVELLDIAKICNEEGIRIAHCQLGCFS